MATRQQQTADEQAQQALVASYDDLDQLYVQCLRLQLAFGSIPNHERRLQILALIEQLAVIYGARPKEVVRD